MPATAPCEQEHGMAVKSQHIDHVSATQSTALRTSLASSPTNMHAAPLPNPPFVFPARTTTPPAASEEVESSAIETQSPHGFTASSPINISRLQSAPVPLPVFSFNPSSNGASVNDLMSPPLSPQSGSLHRPSPSRVGGHRRGGSEFIGGDGKSGSGFPLMSTSPLTGEGVPSIPNPPTPLAPVSGRRGHSHRRSAAISCHDIATISKSDVLVPILGGSAPTSPSEISVPLFSFPRSQTWSGDATHSHNVSAYLTTQSHSPPASPKGPNRTRVGFSDTLEFIPRPLSLISSDASSTTTIKPNHSLSGSLSSIASVAAFSISITESRGLPSPASTICESDSRIDNEEAIHDLSLSHTLVARTQRSQKEATSRDSLNRPLTPKSPRKYLFFGQDGRSEHSSEASRPATSDSETSHSPITPPHESQQPQADACAAKLEQRLSPGKQSPTKKTSKKKKRVRAWAGSILTKRSRQRSQKGRTTSRRSPTPPLSMYQSVVIDSEDVVVALNEDCRDHEDDFFGTSAEVSSVPDDNPPADSKPDFSTWKPRHVSISEDEDNARDVIDLDAAMGPFNTPSANSYDPLWEEAQREAPKSPRRRMHSGAVARGYMRKDVTFHRRSESAPEMENPHFSLHRLGSNSTMADVFEEDEEDEPLQAEKMLPLPSLSSTPPETIPDKKVIISHEAQADPVIMVPTCKSKYSSQQLHGEFDGGRKRLKREASMDNEINPDTTDDSASSSVVVDEGMHDRVQEDCNTCGYAPGETESLRNSKAAMVVHMGNRPDDDAEHYRATNAGPSRLQFYMPVGPPTFSPTSIPSPRSPLSYDAMQLTTDLAAVDDEALSEYVSRGKLVHDTRVSVDDVPSLTSSRSTMTRGSQGNPSTGYTQSRSGHRSASPGAVSMTAKRSSIASLSRLLNSSHGSKSKLSLQEGVSDSVEPKTKVSRGKRLSRLMQFWKAKDECDSA